MCGLISLARSNIIFHLCCLSPPAAGSSRRPLCRSRSTSRRCQRRRSGVGRSWRLRLQEGIMFFHLKNPFEMFFLPYHTWSDKQHAFPWSSPHHFLRHTKLFLIFFKKQRCAKYQFSPVVVLKLEAALCVARLHLDLAPLWHGDGLQMRKNTILIYIFL